MQFNSASFFCLNLFFLISSSLNFLFPQINESDTSENINPERAIQWIYGFDNRRTHIQQQGTLIYGAYTGIGYRDKLRLKIGISGTPFEVGKMTDEFGNSYFNRMLFFNIGQEYDYLNWSRYRMTAYTQIGYGRNNFRIVNQDNTYESGSNRIIPLELGTHFNYFIYDWLALKVGGGWRFVFPTDINDLSGYYLKLALGMNLKKFYSSYQTWKLNRENE